MARHTVRHAATGRFMSAKTPAPTGSKPKTAGHHGGKPDMDLEMERASQESAKWDEGRWDQDQEVNRSITDGTERNEDWKGRGNTVAGVWQGSQHRRAHHGYDVAEQVAPSERSNYKPEDPHHIDAPDVTVTRAQFPERRAQAMNAASYDGQTSYLTSGK